MSEQKLSRERIEKQFEKYGDLLIVQEFAEIMRIATKTAYEILNEGYLEYFIVKNRYYIPKEWLIDYLMKYGYVNKTNDIEALRKKALYFCSQNPKCNAEIAAHLGINAGTCKNVLLNGLVNNGEMRRMHEPLYTRGGVVLYKTIKKKDRKGEADET